MNRRVKVLSMMLSFILCLTLAVEPLVAADITINDEKVKEAEQEAVSALKGEEEDSFSIKDKEIIEHDKTQVPGEGTAKISWKVLEEKFSGSYEVELYYDELKENKCTTEVVKDIKNTSVRISGLKQNQPYYVFITPEQNGEKAKELMVEVRVLTAPTLKVESGERKLTLSWGAVDQGSVYEIYDVENEKSLGRTSELTFVHENLKNGIEYRYQIRAIHLDENGKELFASAWSKESAGVKTKVVTPDAPTGVKASLNDSGVKLTWQAAAGATSYYVYTWDTSKKAWVYVKNVTNGTTFTQGGLSAGKTYKYKLKSVCTSGGVTLVSGFSSEVSVSTGENIPASKIRPIFYRATVKKRTQVYFRKSLGAKAGYLNAGTKVTVVTHPSKVSGVNLVQVQLSNGKIYWVRRSRLDYYGSIYTSSDYTKAEKETFVNSKGYSSSTNYLIWISTYTQRVNIYQGSKGNWKLIRNCRVATGKHSTPTPRGTYKITYKEKGWYYSTTCVKKIVHFAGRNSFHSRIYRYNGSLSDATIGRPASNGCIRMYMEDINYIYNSMPKGTTVISY